MLRWINKIKQRMIEKYDFWIYRLSYKSLNRMCKSNGGFAYLFELSLHKWLEENPISFELKESTEKFFNIISDHKK